jgi:hypothetical protein
VANLLRAEGVDRRRRGKDRRAREESGELSPAPEPAPCPVTYRPSRLPIAADSQRLINETYSAFVQGFMPTLARPEVDVLEGLTTAIIVDQQRMGAGARSTVATATDANAMLRILLHRRHREALRRELSSVSTRSSGQPSSTVSESFDGIP